MRIHIIGSDLDVLSVPGDSGWSGRALLVHNLAGALADDGHDVTIVGPSAGAGGRGEQRLRPGLTVSHVPPGPDLDVLRDHVERLWSGAAPHVVHALDRTAGVAAADGAAVRGAALVQSFAAVTGAGDGSAQDVLLHRAERVLTDSDSQLDDLLRRGATRSRLSVVPPGVDTEVWQPDGDSLRRGDSPRIVHVGSLRPDGGADEAVAAMRYLPDAELYLAGGPAPGVTDDADLLRLQELAARTAVTRRVRFLGAVGQDNVVRLLRSAEVVVCASHGGGCGASALEAMACGRPVVATGVGSQRDMVVDGVTGVQVRPGRPVELGTAMRTVLADPTSRQAYGIAGRDRVLARYAWPRIARSVAAVYDEAVHELHPEQAVRAGPRVEAPSSDQVVTA